MKKILAVLFAVGCAFAGYHFTLQKGFVNPYPIVCDLVAQKIYLKDEQIKKWHRRCQSRSRLVTPYSTRALIIKDLNNLLGTLNVSHLEVYDSSQVKSIWRGENLETGIESEFIDSELVIFKIHPKSPAEAAGLKKGDIIRAIGKEQPNPWEAKSESGVYSILRKKKELKITLKAAPIKRMEEVSFESFPKGDVLGIPSFRADFFSTEALIKLQKKLKNTKRLVIDLRGNNGGNFVAGLRFLSLMICDPQEVGRLVRPRFKTKNSAPMINDLSDIKQLAQLDKYQVLSLKTFPLASCYRGEVRVLTDSKTSSVAELVAQALKEVRKARLLGTPSRGQMLVGVWYPLSEISPGVEISIPEAVYRSLKGHELEGQGVELDKVLYYDLAEMQAGIDSWVKKALD